MTWLYDTLTGLLSSVLHTACSMYKKYVYIYIYISVYVYMYIYVIMYIYIWHLKKKHGVIIDVQTKWTALISIQATAGFPPTWPPQLLSLYASVDGKKIIWHYEAST